MNKENIYLKALEIGYNLGDEGISFNRLKKKLKDLKYEFNEELFRGWFYRSFEHKTRIEFSQQPLRGIATKEDDNKFRLCSDSLFQYLEYVELKEARANSETAKNQANDAYRIALLSVVVAVISLVGSLFLTQNVSDNKVENQLKELNKIIYENQIRESQIYENHQHNDQSLKSPNKQVDTMSCIKETEKP